MRLFITIRGLSLFATIITLLLSACGHEHSGSNTNNERLSDEQLAHLPAPLPKGFVFSFDPRSSPQEDARQYQPLLDYLNRRTGYTFTLRFTPRDNSLAEELRQGQIHLAAAGAVTYLQAAAQEPRVTPLVRGKNSNGEVFYRAAIVVRPESPIHTVADLRGHSLAFGATDSTQGHLIPRIMLAQNGIRLDQLASHAYTGSHQNCADAVISHYFDACGMQDTLAERLAREGRLRIVQYSGYYPSSGIIAGPLLPAEARDKIRQALIDFDPIGRDRPGLYHWERTEMPTGFSAADTREYEELKQRLTELDLLSPAQGNTP